MDTLAWVTRWAGAVLRRFPAPPSAAAEQFVVDTTSKAIGFQLGRGRRVRLAPPPLLSVPRWVGRAFRVETGWSCVLFLLGAPGSRRVGLINLAGACEEYFVLGVSCLIPSFLS